ncbi:uncharacterized protein B0H64DRAFT_444730 [Chaetomium fimeti]|uniref:Dicer-like protein 2 n=1 Tax=Chaetomium fimeti TaxID=1854472 RepID=A0AAE0LQ97_9PEZI|nr:hypothetical protein B0H64DRAFT_444730 [Chaetomium fimeti]
MASDHGSSSSSEPDDEPFHKPINESDTVLSSDGSNVSDDVRSEPRDSPRSTTPDDEPPVVVTMTARAYQLEMLEESLKQNIIVAMDTGSGKTQVAILRIKIEMEQSDKIAWFLAPTVSLAEQQFEAIRAQIPGVQSKLILGSDSVDAWSTMPGVWDAVLLNTRIVVSTYQILFDAVAHALIPLSSLGLVVIDEAHNSKGRNPIARLMKEHYVPSKAKGLAVPHILGLTASPLMRSNLGDLEVLEQTLDAVCKTPSKHRDELMAQVNRPEMKATAYGAMLDSEADAAPTPTMARLKSAYLELDMRQDPYVRHLLTDNTPRSRARLKKVLLTKQTYCRSQMESFCRGALDICKSCGPWAADYYIHRVISAFTKDPATPSHSNDNLAEQERKYLVEAFLKVDAQPPAEIPTALSPKVQALLDALGSHQGKPFGIVFVKERATVAVLSHILTVHPKTSHRYRVGSMVGTSRVPGRRQDFLDLSQKEYLLSLLAFRRGTTNLLVATSVLEEGIDVPACNLVICFDKPDNLKSFIQRRGRARMSESQLYLLVEDESDGSSQGWQDLEKEMKRKYEDDMRENKRLEEIENIEDLDYPVLRSQETGAQITILDAKSHLEHFCATLSTRKFVDWSPFYVVHDIVGNPIDAHQPGLRKATVHLPVSLAPELRCFESLQAWTSEANACKDAAFQAYAKLYEVGLVNRNLLPIRETDLLKDVEQRAGLATVREQFNPWPLVAQAWQDGVPVSRRRVTVSRHDESARAELELALPVTIPTMEPFNLYWSHTSSWLIRMDSDTPMSSVTVESQADHTSTLFSMAFGHRWQVAEKRLPVRFTCLDRNVRLEDMASEVMSAELMSKKSSTYLVRDLTNQNHPYFYLGWIPTKPAAELIGKPYRGFEDAPEDSAYVAVKGWPKKSGAFRPLHQNAAPNPSSKPYPRVLPADQVRVDSVPAIYAHIGMMVPAITHALETHLVAKDLLESRLEQTGITDLSLVVTAITASAARGPTDYERIEFLGDSILKFCTTINCSAKYLKFPEGCLSPLKDKIVSNSRLFRAAVDFGLDRYIIHKAFSLHKWRPTYVEDLLENPPSATETRRLSTKIIADVVEALIGTSFVSGGIPNALACMSLFLPEVEWSSIEDGREILYNEAPDGESLPRTMRQLESLIGYNFTKKALLVEAMTHPSCNGPGIRASLDRLEFLGDAILDYVVVNKLFAISHPAPLENSALHLLRSALVNADILGFLVMEWAITEDCVEVTVTTDNNNNNNNNNNDDEDGGTNTTSTNTTTTTNNNKPDVHLTPSKTTLPLWTFLRHASPDMGLIQRATALHHAAMRDEILEALWRGASYPWSLLCRLQAQKFYSDVFESLLGAVWVDSGDLAACEAVVDRLGILPLMCRLVSDGVHLMHPKEELGVLAVSDKVEYVVEAQVGEGVAEGERVFRCEVAVGGVVLGRAEGAASREEARTRAAEGACGVLRGRKGEGVVVVEGGSD